MTIATESLQFPITTSVTAGATRHGQGAGTVSFARRGASLLEDGVMVLALPYLFAIGVIAACLPLALLVALLRWVGR